MADPNTFKTVITAEDDSAAGWASFNDRSRKAQGAAVNDADKARKQATSSWAKLKTGVGKAVAPARILSPEMDRVFGMMEKLGKVSRSMQTNFVRPAGSTAAGPRGLPFSPDEIKAAGREAMTGGRLNLQPPKLRLGKLGSAAEGAASEAGAVEGAASEVGALAGAAGEAGVAAEGAVVALGAVTAGLGTVVLGAAAAGIALEVVAAKFSSGFAKSAQEVQNAAVASGLDARTLQRWRGAAERAGLGQGAADQALGGLGMTLHNLQYGQGSATERNLLEQSGVRVGAPGEKVDVDGAVDAISKRAAAIQDPFTRINYLRQLHMESLAPLLAQGPEKVKANLAASDSNGIVMADATLNKGSAQAERLVDFRQTMRGKMNEAGEVATDLSAPGIEAATGTLRAVDPKKLIDSFGGVVAGAGAKLGGLASAAEHAAQAMLGITPVEAAEPSRRFPRGGGGRSGAQGEGEGSVEPGVAEVRLPRTSTAPVPVDRLPGAQRMRRDIERTTTFVRPDPKPAPPAAVQARAEGGRRAWGPALTPAINTAIENAAQLYHQDPEQLRRVAYQESRFKTNVSPGTTSAQGLFQFIESTWLATLKKHGGDEGVGYGREAAEIALDERGRPHVNDQAQLEHLLDLRGNAQLNAFMGAALRADNADTFRRKEGREPTQGEQYGAHMLGIGKEERLVELTRTHPQEAAASEFPREAAFNRPTFFRGGRPVTMEDLAALFERYGARQGDGAAPPQPQDVRVHIFTEGQPVKTIVQHSRGVTHKTYRTRRGSDDVE